MGASKSYKDIGNGVMEMIFDNVGKWACVVENIESEEEDGEIRIEEDKDSNYHMHETEQERADSVIRDDKTADDPRKSPDVPVESEALKTRNIDSSNSLHARHGGVSRMADEQTHKVDGSSDPNSTVVEIHSTHNDQPNTPHPFGAGPLNGLVNSGCFGPFPSQTNTNLDSPSDPNDQRFDIGGSVRKRRRLLKVNSRLPTSQIGEPQIRKNLKKTLFPPLDTSLDDNGINHPPLFDLNTRCDSYNSDSTTSGRNTISEETRKTVEIGRKIGIEIAEEDPILQEILLGEGGTQVIPRIV
ncbi:hypothetical protein L2E82_05497 [Cichorium intybus]|uniref:Uncharacterized protein n=1 Tax=Cichorium intybus TaxID=13427 RepID=A0ACB9H872_CICIN|nr:hypothetical protein L2E82_05497 [Cichorium intybus]